MADHLTVDEIDQLSLGELPAEALERADTHLATCASCRDLLAGAVSSGCDLLDAVRAEGRSHLTFEQLERGVEDEGALDPLARQHLAACDTCHRELEDLRQFDTLQPVMRTATDASPGANTAAQTRAAGRAWWRMPMWSFAGAAALVVLAAVIWRFVPSTAVPVQLTVQLTNQPAVAPPRSTVGSNAETDVSNEVLLAIARARGAAERTGQPQAIYVQIERRQYEGLLRQLRTEGALDSVAAGRLPEGNPSGIVRVRLTLMPPG
jgi:hypothetical protein